MSNARTTGGLVIPDLTRPYVSAWVNPTTDKDGVAIAALAANGILYGAWVDLMPAAPDGLPAGNLDGFFWATGMRVFARADVVGIIGVQGSDDAVNPELIGAGTSLVQTSTTGLAVAGQGQWAGTSSTIPPTRYCRWTFTNGAGAQTLAPKIRYRLST